MSYISLTTDHSEQLKYLDQVIINKSLDEIRIALEQETIVEKLKGSGQYSGPIVQLVQSHNTLSIENNTLKMDVMGLKEDVKNLTRLVAMLASPQVPQYSSELSSLKSRYGLY